MLIDISDNLLSMFTQKTQGWIMMTEKAAYPTHHLGKGIHSFAIEKP